MRKIQRDVAERYQAFLPTDSADEPEFELSAKSCLLQVFGKLSIEIAVKATECSFRKVIMRMVAIAGCKAMA